MPVVSLENVSIYASVTAQNPILMEVTFDVAPAEMVYLVGKVGSGKTSLLKTLYAETPLKTGSGTVCGYNLRKLSNRAFYDLRRSVGFVFQDYNLFSEMTIYKNLEFVLRATDWKKRTYINNRIGEVLEMVNLVDKAYSLPTQISGGERQRISIARALLNSPELILADEPTGNLDPVAAAEVISLLSNIAQASNCGVIVSTHNSENLRHVPARSLRCAHGFVEQI